MHTAHATSAIVPTYARANLAFERGEGGWLIATTGERYLDFGSGIAVTALGHAHPHLVAALDGAGREALARLQPLSESRRRALRARGCATRPSPTSCSSPIPAPRRSKARSRWRGKRQSVDGHPERYRIITFEGAFHGRTLATLAAGGQAKYLDGFGPKVEGFDQVPFADLDAVRRAIGPETAAIMIEPIRARAACGSIPPSFLRGLRELCDRHGLLLIFDEVQTRHRPHRRAVRL